MKRRVIKTILYRTSTVIMQQVASWLLFHEVKVNLVFLGLESVRCGYYYLYDWLWEKFQSTKAK